jgi:uncharacterized repeat protein (TIGR01451 family)
LIPSTAHFLGVQAYVDDSLTNAVTTIAFGNIAIDDTKTQTVWLRNTGDQELTLSLTFTDVLPTNTFDYITVTWDREGVKIGPKSTLSATFTMHADEDWPISNGDISFVMNINGA